MSIANDIRAAAALYTQCADDADNLILDEAYRREAAKLRAHADTIERVEREMRKEVAYMEKDQHKYAECAYTTDFQTIDEWADALKGNAT